MLKKYLLPLLLLSTNSYSAVPLDALKAAYIYQISKYAIGGYSPSTYCINDTKIADRLIETNKPISVSKNYVLDCEVLFNYNNSFGLTFTDREQDKEDYMFLLVKEDDKLVIYRNINKTKDLYISEKYLNLMKTY